MRIDPEAPNVIHTTSRRAAWSRANEKGVFPGVSTPLNWSIWGALGERAVRLGAFDLGLLDEGETGLPESIDDWGWSIFYGRPSANVDTWRRLYERGLGGDGQGAATQRQVFGDGPGASIAHETSDAREDSIERRALIARKREVAFATSPARLAATRREAIAWWREATRVRTASEAQARFEQAIDLFARADRDHIVASLLSTEAVTALSAAAEAVGRPEDANALMVGYPGMEEFETAVAVWDLSRGRITLDEFLAEHGFHGSMEGEIASRSWREDPDPVSRMAVRYATLAEAQEPRAREDRAVSTRARLEDALRASTPAGRRAALERGFELAARCLPMREAGRATLTIALDGMRAAARVIGRDWAARGRIDSAEDVFLLTRQELLSPPGAFHELVAARKALVAEYARFDLPENWQGMPERLARQVGSGAARVFSSPGGGRSSIETDWRRGEAGEQAPIAGGSADSSAPLRLRTGDRLEGLGASAGVHEGIARVVLDPADPALEFDGGDVLVAPATDPSWAPLFLVAGAVVIDTGSNISHAAVVAREMGIPAVVAARAASLSLVSGQRLRVDGKMGIVEVLADPREKS